MDGGILALGVQRGHVLGNLQTQYYGKQLKLN